MRPCRLLAGRRGSAPLPLLIAVLIVQRAVGGVFVLSHDVEAADDAAVAPISEAEGGGAAQGKMGVETDAQTVAAVRQNQALGEKTRAGTIAAFQDKVVNGARRGAADKVKPDGREMENSSVYSEGGSGQATFRRIKQPGPAEQGSAAERAGAECRHAFLGEKGFQRNPAESGHEADAADEMSQHGEA
ncbi:hypothetical protein HMPREF9080_00703 [Cardiobacterium valvarum F0432]|uniref:Uncharacterized protein n=1 Tax=Cardiobacterium valvarum F0432 TaxID=797473 RepID=G9ZD69_9GAMM|nr:hypothetical protein HMPREF9080_00703 [Cardiobacterium valvarum F0432]